MNNELVERIEDINYWLRRDYGRTGEFSTWRVVWSDYLETVKGWFVQYDDSGNFLGAERGIGQAPKYTYIKDRYVLERIMPVPEENKEELLGRELSYEPVFVFERANGDYLPPRFEVCKLVIEAILDRAARAVGYTKYKNPEDDHDPLEVKMERIKKLQEELFGPENEDVLSHRLHVGEAISVPQNYENATKEREK